MTTGTTGLWMKKITVKSERGGSSILINGWDGEDPNRCEVNRSHGPYQSEDAAIEAAFDDVRGIPNDVDEVLVISEAQIGRSIPINRRK